VLHLVKYRKLFILFSMLVIVPGLISLIFFQLNLGTDFLGGTNIVLRPQKTVTADQVTNLLKPFNLKNDRVILGTDQGTATNIVWIRLKSSTTPTPATTTDNIKAALTKKYSGVTLNQTFSTITTDPKAPYTLLTITGFKTLPTAADITSVLNTVSTADSTAKPTTPPAPKVAVADVQVGNNKQTINILSLTSVLAAHTSNDTKETVALTDVQGAFLKNGGPYFQEESITSVGADVAGRTVEMSFLAVAAAAVLILAYVWFSFRKVPKALRYGVSAIVALLHDVLVVLGIFSILGHFFNVQIDSLFITALLTIIGFSVHDTIVVFDRIRENMQRSTNEPFEDVVNASLIQTMARSLNTSLTVIFTMLTLTLFTENSGSVHIFTLALLIGIISGTYSSIFNASMILVIWEKGELGIKYLQRNRKTVAARSTSETRELAETHS
jgi:preprotein translocase SecF subunit